MTFIIQVNDAEIRAKLAQLKTVSTSMRAVFMDIGQGIKARTIQRFSTSSAPDGTRWKPLAKTTYNILADKISKKKGNTLKDGRLNTKGAGAISAKKILIQNGDLMRQFNVLANDNSVTVGNTMRYAAIHQFGGKAGRGRKVTIPARPFLPIMLNGQLYEQERVTIMQELNDFIQQKLAQK